MALESDNTVIPLEVKVTPGRKMSSEAPPAEVVDLGPSGKFSPEQTLAWVAKQNPDKVVVIYLFEDGDRCKYDMIASDMTNEAVLYAIEKTKHLHILSQ